MVGKGWVIPPPPLWQDVLSFVHGFLLSAPPPHSVHPSFCNFMLVWVGMNWYGLVSVGIGLNGLVLVGMGWYELVWVGMGR